MKILKSLMTLLFIIFIFVGCDTKEKIDYTAKKVKQMEKQQAEMKKELDYYKNKEEKATSYIQYVTIFISIIVGLYIMRIIFSKALKLIKRG